MIVFLLFENIAVYWASVFILADNFEYTDHIPNVLFNQAIITPLFLYLSNMLFSGDNYEFPKTPEILRDFFMCYVFQCFAFYFVHRLLHTKLLWRSVHSIHHEYLEPIPSSALYCHWLEHAALNIFPVLLGPYLLSCCLQTTRIWTLIATISTVVAHSRFGSTHLCHHLHRNCNFGSGAILDKLFGTDCKC
jgi:sterol desaturase/sphingolipid hydroxylase (fatty acid hydroxylase superfamily)